MRATVLTAIILISSSFPAAFAGENISAGEISVSRLAEDTDRESRERRETEMLFMANKAYEDGFYDVALSMMERFRKDFPDSGKISHAYLLTGQSYLSQGRYAQAMEVFDSLSSDPKAQDIKDAVCFWTAEAYFKENDFEKAVSFYEKLIRAFPGSAYLPEAYYSLGWTFFQMGRYSQAADSLKDFLEKFPGEPQSKDAAFKLVECFYNLKEYSRLKEAIGSVLKIYSGDTLRLSYLYFYLAESEYYLGDYREAAKNYLKSMRSFQDKKARALANLGLGWSYLKLEKYKDAEDVFSGIDQGDLDEKGLEVLLLGQAVLMSHSNRAYEAKKIYQRLIEISQDPFMRIQAYIGKADAFYSLSDYNEAVEIYQEGLKYMRGKGKQPAEVKALADKLAYNLGLAYVKNNANKLALEAFESVVSGGTDNTAKAEALCRMGEIGRAHV
jgi:TolA-binding protein